MRELVIEARQRETPQIADDEQRVLVDRIGVKKVVLHAPDDAAECRNVEAEHTIEIHASQFVGDTFLGAQDCEKQPMVAWILAEFLVDQVQIAFDQADRVCADAANVRVLLQYQE